MTGFVQHPDRVALERNHVAVAHAPRHEQPRVGPAAAAVVAAPQRETQAGNRLGGVAEEQPAGVGVQRCEQARLHGAVDQDGLVTDGTRQGPARGVPTDAYRGAAAEGATVAVLAGVGQERAVAELGQRALVPTVGQRTVGPAGEGRDDLPAGAEVVAAAGQCGDGLTTSVPTTGRPALRWR